MNEHLTRRRFFYQNLTGLGGVALLDLLRRDPLMARRVTETPLSPRHPHHAAKAKSCIFLTMLGGVSQVDTFDPKPALQRFDGTAMDWSKEKTTDQPGLFAKPRLITASPFRFARHGKCGMEISELFPILPPAPTIWRWSGPFRLTTATIPPQFSK